METESTENTKIESPETENTEIDSPEIEGQSVDTAMGRAGGEDEAGGTRGHGDGDWGLTPGDQLRALPAEAESRGTRFVSAQAMQARLFSVYDAAAAAEEALALVQEQLTLTLDRQYYEAGEIEEMANELDALLLFPDELDEGLATGA